MSSRELEINTIASSVYEIKKDDLTNETINIVRADDEESKTTIPTVGYVNGVLNSDLLNYYDKTASDSRFTKQDELSSVVLSGEYDDGKTFSFNFVIKK